MKRFFAKLTVKKTERDFGVNISYFNENSLFLKLLYCCKKTVGLRRKNRNFENIKKVGWVKPNNNFCIMILL